MNPRQRILAVLDRQPVDRPAVDIWMTPEVHALLAKHTGKQDPLEMYHALGVDKMVWVHPPYKGPLPEPKRPDEIVSLWGTRMKTQVAGDAEYAEAYERSLQDIEDADELDDYEYWPDPDLFDIDAMAAQGAEAEAAGFATLGPWVSFFEIYCQMRGQEEAMVDILAEPELVTAALDRIEAIQTGLLERFLSRKRGIVDAIFYSDDMGSQNDMLISPAAWREHIKPRVKRWCDLAHAHGVRVLHHTDGAVDKILPELVDCGIDILNPIQHRCPGMAMPHLRSAYGDRIIFHGGVDTQDVLPFGTADDVRRETKKCLDELGEGFICCSCHNIQAGTPLENILAMIETARNYRR